MNRLQCFPPHPGIDTNIVFLLWVLNKYFCNTYRKKSAAITLMLALIFFFKEQWTHKLLCNIVNNPYESIQRENHCDTILCVFCSLLYLGTNDLVGFAVSWMEMQGIDNNWIKLVHAFDADHFYNWCVYVFSSPNFYFYVFASINIEKGDKLHPQYSKQLYMH